MRRLWGWEFFREFDIYQLLLNAVQFTPSITSLARPIVAELPAQFVGFHLRAEADATWHSYEAIVAWFKEQYIPNFFHIKTIYVATGDRTIEERFRTEMKAVGFDVYPSGLFWRVKKNSLQK